MPHPFSLMEWLYCDQVGEALAPTVDEIPHWTSWAYQLVGHPKVQSISPSGGYPQLERASLVEYCKDKNIPPRRLDPSWTEEQSSSGAMAHDTRLMRLLWAAIKEFWSTYDPDQPDTAPRTPEIVEWLMKQGASGREAKAIDLIIRPDSRKKGGR
jgi:hypothetical protein